MNYFGSHKRQLSGFYEYFNLYQEEFHKTINIWFSLRIRLIGSSGRRIMNLLLAQHLLIICIHYKLSTNLSFNTFHPNLKWKLLVLHRSTKLFITPDLTYISQYLSAPLYWLLVLLGRMSQLFLPRISRGSIDTGMLTKTRSVNWFKKCTSINYVNTLLLIWTCYMSRLAYQGH